MHVFLAHQGAVLDPKDASFNYQLVTHRHAPLIKQVKMKRPTPEVSLIHSDSRTAVDENKTEDIIVRYFKPRVHIRVVSSQDAFYRGTFPHDVTKAMSFDPETGAYWPVLYFDDFWQTNRDLMEIGERAPETTNITIEFSSLGFYRWQFQVQVDAQWHTQQELGIIKESNMDGIRQLLVDTDPRLLCATAIASILHTIFNFLAFSSDVSFFQQHTEFDGISLRSLLTNCVFQTIILLFLFDNDTNFVVKLNVALGLVTEYWKAARAFKLLRFSRLGELWRGAGSGGPGGPGGPEGPGGPAQGPSRSEEYDKIATDNMMLVTAPLVLGYAIYSLVSRPSRTIWSEDSCLPRLTTTGLLSVQILVQLDPFISRRLHLCMSNIYFRLVSALTNRTRVETRRFFTLRRSAS